MASEYEGRQTVSCTNVSKCLLENRKSKKAKVQAESLLNKWGAPIVLRRIRTEERLEMKIHSPTVEHPEDLGELHTPVSAIVTLFAARGGVVGTSTWRNAVLLRTRGTVTLTSVTTATLNNACCCMRLEFRIGWFERCLVHDVFDLVYQMHPCCSVILSPIKI